MTADARQDPAGNALEALEAPPHVLVEERDGWMELVLNRPERRNALDIPTIEQLNAGLSKLRESTDARVLLLRGEGPAFCAGLDLKAVHADGSPEWIVAYNDRWLRFHTTLAELSIPVVCAMQGPAVNAGAGLALSADFLIAGEESYLQVGEAHQGLAAPFCIAWLTMRHSPALARRITLRADKVSGPELRRLGIAAESVPGDRVLDTARELAAELSRIPSRGLERTLAGLRAAVPQEDVRAYFERITEAVALTGDREFRPRFLNGRDTEGRRP
ncbi:enoyl-CoA hydratase/isomerase family protein [Streptomyces sp. NPDC004838]